LRASAIGRAEKERRPYRKSGGVTTVEQEFERQGGYPMHMDVQMRGAQEVRE